MIKLQGPILVGTDFSAASEEALRQGYDLANNLDASLIVCHVIPELDTIDLLFPQLAARNAEHREMLTKKAMTAVERQIATRHNGRSVKIRAVVDSGTPHAPCLLKRTLRRPVS